MNKDNKQTTFKEIKQCEKQAPLHDEILELLKRRSMMGHEYINPNFLQEISCSLEAYYQCEDDTVDAWILDMFGA